MALPCVKSCVRYYEGCHKTCWQWKIQTTRQSEKCQKAKAFLKEQNETSGIIIRQCIALSPRKNILLLGQSWSRWQTEFSFDIQIVGRRMVGYSLFHLPQLGSIRYKMCDVLFHYLSDTIIMTNTHR